MKDNFNGEQYLFAVQVMDAQEAALDQIGRALTEDELHMVRKGLQAGLGDAQSIVMETAIEEAVNDPDIDHSDPLPLDYWPFNQGEAPSVK
jgi:hypothetical protein